MIEKRIAAGLPTLGICLGAQLIARALGARVYPSGHTEIGWTPLALTDAGRASPVRHLDGAHTSMLHWHGDTFDLPDNATRLASTPACENQAFAWGNHVLGLQCHPEIRTDRFEPWLIGNAGRDCRARVSTRASCGPRPRNSVRRSKPPRAGCSANGSIRSRRTAADPRFMQKTTRGAMLDRSRVSTGRNP